MDRHRGCRHSAGLRRCVRDVEAAFVGLERRRRRCGRFSGRFGGCSGRRRAHRVFGCGGSDACIRTGPSGFRFGPAFRRPFCRPGRFGRSRVGVKDVGGFQRRARLWNSAGERWSAVRCAGRRLDESGRIDAERGCRRACSCASADTRWRGIRRRRRRAACIGRFRTRLGDRGRCGPAFRQPCRGFQRHGRLRCRSHECEGGEIRRP